jgi:hypothetical protein
VQENMVETSRGPHRDKSELASAENHPPPARAIIMKLQPALGKPNPPALKPAGIPRDSYDLIGRPAD